MFSRTLISISAIFIAILFISPRSVDAGNKVKKIIIQTPTLQCGMCKKAIENALDTLNGVESADVDYKKKITTVKYDSDLVTSDQIREKIPDVGYDADKAKANKKSYGKLPKCCKLPEDR